MRRYLELKMPFDRFKTSQKRSAAVQRSPAISVVKGPRRRPWWVRRVDLSFDLIGMILRASR